VSDEEAGASARSLVEKWGVADSAVFCVTQFSAIRTEGLGSAVGSTTGGTGGRGTILGEENVGAGEAAAGRSDVFGVAPSAAGLVRA